MASMNTVSRAVVHSAVLLGLVLYTGCGKQQADIPKTYPVSIKIAHKGQPVEGANVMLVPQDASGKGASGTTDASGVAKMGLPGLAEGAIPGKYWVSVSKVAGTQSDPNISAEEFYQIYEQQGGNADPAASGPQHLLPVKYLSAQSAGLECVVEEKDDQLFEFDLTD